MGSGEGDADSAGTATTTATATIEDVRIEVKTTRVYNLEVENLHTFFVGEQGLIVHNARRGPPVTQNRDAGKQWEKDVANAINDKGVNRAELGTRGFKTPFGWRFPDIFVYDGGGALIALLECKAGGAKRSRHQRDKDDWIRNNHNVPTIEIGHK